MPTTYTLPDPVLAHPDDEGLFAATREAPDLLADVLRDYHPKLNDLGVRIDLLFAAAEDHRPLKLKGHKVLARVRVEPLRNRIRGVGDALIEIDRRAWDKLSRASRVALLDHECSHLSPVFDSNGRPRRDDLGRPVVKTVRADVDVGDAFKAVIERHGKDAVEFANLKRGGAYAAYYAGEPVDDATDDELAAATGEE